MSLAPMPHSPEAEACVLAAVLIGDESALSLVEPEQMYAPGHAEVLAAMTRLKARKAPIDAVTVEGEMGDSAKLIGGIEGISALADRYAYSGNVRAHAGIVRDRAARRAAISAAHELVARCHELDSTDVAETLSEHQKAVAKIAMTGRASTVTYRDAVLKAMCEITEGSKGVARRALTGIKAIDAITNGVGMGEVWVIGGTPGMGKSTLGMNIAHNHARGNGPVLVFQIEMPDDQVVRRAMAETAVGPDIEVLKAIAGGQYMPTEDQWRGIIRAADAVSSWPCHLHTQSNKIGQLEAEARRWRSLPKVAKARVALVVVDYLQLMRGVTGTRSRTEELEEITARIKSLAKELGVGIIVLSQLNRASASRATPRPILSDLRSSGSIEQDADMVAFIYRPVMHDKAAPEREAELIVEKNRDGRAGETIKLEFDGAHGRFRNPPDWRESA